MTEERNMLMSDIYPELRQYCQKYGLDFQVDVIYPGWTAVSLYIGIGGFADRIMLLVL